MMKEARLKILDALSATPRSTAADIADSIGLPVLATQSLLATLARLGDVVVNADRQYSLARKSPS